MTRPRRKTPTRPATTTSTGLQPGQYRAVETNLPGYLSLADADGGNPDNISPIVLPLGGTVTDRDFEDTRLASVSGVRLRGPEPGRQSRSR